jgi:putative membrane protein
LRRVDHLRAEFASGEAQRVEKAARRWLQALPQHAAILPALTASETPEAMLALLRAGPAHSLREATDVLGRTTALRSVAIIAATPSPALDALALGWCGVRLIRQVATLRMRPGLMGTLSLAKANGVVGSDRCSHRGGGERSHARNDKSSALASSGR